MARLSVALLATALLLLLLGPASAARLPEQVDTLGLKTSDAVAASLAAVHLKSHTLGRANEEGMAIISTRYIVPPSMHDQFIDKWQSDVFQSTREEQGCNMYDMSKTKHDNVLFSTYGEWQSWEAFNAHLDSEHVKAWLTFLADNKVAFTWYSLGTPGNDVRPEPEPSNAEADQGAFVLTRYHVPLALRDGFVSTWQQVCDEVRDKEQGKVAMYALREVETDSSSFFLYGSWDSWASYMEHFKSEHAKKLLDYDRDNDIAWFLAPLRKYGRKDQ